MPKALKNNQSLISPMSNKILYLKLAMKLVHQVLLILVKRYVKFDPETYHYINNLN